MVAQFSQTSPNLLSVIREQAIYLISIDVCIGRRTKSINPRHISTDENTIKVLTSLQGKITCKMFPKLEKSANKLNYLARKLKNLYLLYSEPFWYLASDSEEEFNTAFYEAQLLASQELEKVENDYFSSKRAYFSAVEELLSTVELEEEERKRAYAVYTGAFPSLSSIQDNFGLRITRREKFPSLQELSREDANLAETEGRIQIIEDYRNLLQSSRQQAMAIASEEISSILNEQIEVLSNYASRDLPESKIKQLEEATNRIGHLVAHTNNMGWDEVVQQLTQLTDSAVQGNYINLNHQLARLKKILEQENSLGPSNQEETAFDWVSL